MPHGTWVLHPDLGHALESSGWSLLPGGLPAMISHTVNSEPESELLADDIDTNISLLGSSGPCGRWRSCPSMLS